MRSTCTSFVQQHYFTHRYISDVFIGCRIVNSSVIHLYKMMADKLLPCHYYTTICSTIILFQVVAPEVEHDALHCWSPGAARREHSPRGVCLMVRAPLLWCQPLLVLRLSLVHLVPTRFYQSQGSSGNLSAICCVVM